MANYSPLGFDTVNAQPDVLNATDTITVAGGIINTPIGQSGTVQDASVDELVAASATVSDLTSGRVVLAGTAGAIEDSGNLLFNGSTLALTGNLTATSTVAAATGSTFGNMTIADGSITTSAVDNNISFGNDNLSTTGNISGADGAFSGDLTVEGDIISRGAVDVIIADEFLDLGFGNTTTTAAAGGFTVSMNRASAFVAGTVTVTTVGNAGVANPTFTYTDAGGGNTSVLAAGDIVAISGMEEAGNDGLFQVASVGGNSLPQTVTISGIGTSAVDGSLPFCQNQFIASTGQTGSAYKVDLAVICLADGTASFKDANGNAYAKGTFVTAFGNGGGNTGAVLTDFNGNADYATAASSLQSAYDGGASWATAGNVNWQGTLSAGNFVLIGGGDVDMGLSGADLGAFGVGTGTATIAATGNVAIDGTGVSIDGTAASNLSVTEATLTVSTITSGVLSIDGAGGLDLNSAEPINIGNDNVAKAINIGTAGGRAITVGGTSATSLTASAGTVLLEGGTLNIGTDTTAGTAINIGAASQANPVVIDAGTSTVGINGAGNIGIGTDADAGNIAIGNAGARAIAIGSGTATAVTVDAEILSFDSADDSNLTMTANNANSKALSIRALNSGNGAGNIVMDAKTDITIDAQNGALKLQQGQMVAHTGGVAQGRVLVMQSATAVAEGASTTLTSFQPYGICVTAANQGDPVVAACFPGSIVQIDCADTAAVGDVLYLTVGGEVSVAVPGAGNTIMRIGTAMAAGTGLILAMYNPQFIAVRNA